MPEAAKTFDSLEDHWPKLVNAMGSKIIPIPSLAKGAFCAIMFNIDTSLP